MYAVYVNTGSLSPEALWQPDPDGQKSKGLKNLNLKGYLYKSH